MEVFRTDPPKGKRSGHWYSSDHVNHHDKTLPSVTAIVGQDPYIKMRKKEKKLAVNALASTLVSKSEPAFREWTGPRGGKHVDPVDKEVDALVQAALDESAAAPTASKRAGVSDDPTNPAFFTTKRIAEIQKTIDEDKYGFRKKPMSWFRDMWNALAG